MTEDPQVMYNILCRGRTIFSELSEDRFFDEMETLAQTYYECGSPSPDEITYETIEVNQTNGSSI